MSDANPKVTVKQDAQGQWIAFCREQDCPWVQSPSEKTYVNQRATAHRREHRDRICEHCDRSDHCELCGGCLAPCCDADSAGCPVRCSCSVYPDGSDA